MLGIACRAIVFSLLAAGLSLLAAPQDAHAHGAEHGRAHEPSSVASSPAHTLLPATRATPPTLRDPFSCPAGSGGGCCCGRATTVINAPVVFVTLALALWFVVPRKRSTLSRTRSHAPPSKTVLLVAAAPRAPPAAL